MSGCEGCLVSNRGQQEQYQTTKQEAIKYAKQQNQTVALYKEGYDYRYCIAEVAGSAGYQILEYLSPDH